MNKLLEVLRGQGGRLCLKIKVKKTKPLGLGTSEDEKVTSGNEKINQVSSFTYLGTLISKDGGSSEDIKSNSLGSGCFFTVKKNGRQVYKPRFEYWKVQL